MPPAESLRAPAGPTRRTPRILLGVAAVLLALRVVLIVTAPREEKAKEPPSGSEKVTWRTIAEAPEEARRTGRPILYDFSAEWCGPCRRMQEEVFADEEAAAYINKTFVPVRVVDRVTEDGRNPPEIKELQGRFKVNAFPTLVAVRPDSSEPVILTGYGGGLETMRSLKAAAARLGPPGAAGPR